jgi:hypothetical protein
MGIINDSMFIGKPEGKELLYRSGPRCELCVRVDLGAAGCEDLN